LIGSEFASGARKKYIIEQGTKTQKRQSGAGRPLKYNDIEEKLISWFRERREAGVRVTGKGMKTEALRLHKENGSQSFKASCGWFRRFKKRNNITFRRSTHVSQHDKKIIDDRIDKFLKFVTRMRKFRGYCNSDIGNMDETPVWFGMPGKCTLSESGVKEVIVSSTGHEKQRITVTLSAFADGTKLPPLGHLPGIRPLPKTDIPNGIVVYIVGG